ncbi:MAG: methyltransferase domain-containing protein [Myxococcales bacterium]|nr:methyltransferase domain-containing protein [Myxococcales bacterium]
MTSELNPQAAQMADESMVRTLAAQADAIWPQEAPLLARYGLRPGARVLDAGCGTGEFTARVLEAFPGVEVLGVDVLDSSLDRARRRCAAFGARARFENRSLFQLGLSARSFDLVACRHVLQAIPRAQAALAELVRVTRAGGWLHLIAEDYGMMHFPRGKLEPDDFWRHGPVEFGAATGTDLHIGRHVVPLLEALGLAEVRVDYVVVDTLRVPRDTFARIWEAWRDGYVEALGQHTRFSAEGARAHFDEMIHTLRHTRDYAVWQVPVVSARVP